MKPNIFFLLIDSFRSDKFYGNSKTSITPNLDKLIGDGTYFTQAISSAPVTCPSISSIFTSCFPFEAVVEQENHFIINPKLPNYVKELTNFGYESFAIVPELISYMGLKDVFQNNLETYHSSSTMYDGLGDRVLEKLDSSSKEPWFFYLHLMDLHGTAEFQLSEGPKKFQSSQYGHNQYEKMISALDVWIGKILERIDKKNILMIITADHGSDVGIYTSEMEKHRRNIRQYEDGIAFHSAKKISSIFPKSLNPLKSKLAKNYTERKRNIIQKKRNLEAKKISEKQLSPYEKRIQSNSINTVLQVYDDRFRVPLLFYGYSIPSKIISNQVRNIDIFPTICDILKLPNISKTRGQSLLSLIEKDDYDELPVMLESASNSPKSLNSNTIGIRTSKYKYFRDRNNSGKNVALFDLEIDPLEENNIAADYPEIVKQMEKIFESIKSDKNFDFNKIPVQNKSDEEFIEDELKKLGYI